MEEGTFSWRGGSKEKAWSLKRARVRLVLGCVAAFLLFAAFLLYRNNIDLTALRETEAIADDVGPELDDYDGLEYYPWHTRSQFRPVKQDVENKTIQDLCDAFPKHLLRDIQPVLKTGHALLEPRVKPQLDSVSACLDDYLLIFSDLDEEFSGYQIIDVVSDLRNGFVQDNEQLREYVIQRELAFNGSLLPGHLAQTKGWEIDKFKFLPQVSRAWRMRPEKRWYVFYEGDTYIVWDNVFRLLTNFNPDMPWYFGSPSPGARDTWFGNGGPGYILSREAVRRLVRADFDITGAFTGSMLSMRWEEESMLNCCGDSILGLAVHEDAKTNLSGLWPMFQPHPLHGIPFSDEYWCQPVISMHKTTQEDMAKLRLWEESRRETRRPLLYADLPQFLNLTQVAVREDWINSDFGGYSAPPDGAGHDSFEACGQACREDESCLQWTYHLQSCTFVSSFRLGQAKSAESDRKGEDDFGDDGEDEGGDELSIEYRLHQFTHEEMRFISGWDLEGIKHWMSHESRRCDVIQWVKPSLERIF